MSGIIHRMERHRTGLMRARRANAIWKRMLADDEAPPIDPAVDEALKEFVAKKKAAMPDAFA